MPDIDRILNLERLEEAYDDDIAAIAELLGMACQTELRYISALRDAIAQSNLREVARAAHSIKGSASNIGAMQLSNVAAEIEDRAKLERWDGIPEFADELDLRYAEVRDFVRTYSAQSH